MSIVVHVDVNITFRYSHLNYVNLLFTIRPYIMYLAYLSFGHSLDLY
jgi:hypothetical protein